MRAMTYRGPYKIRVEDKPMPVIEHPNDAIVRVTLAAICGSDLHLYHGLMPDTRVGHTFGHEFIGVVEQVGPSVQNLQVGDRVMVPFNIFCGSCWFCARGLYSNCHNVNPNATAVGAIYGYSHTTGGYDGGQSQFVRVPFADVGPVKIPDWMHDEDAVLLTDAAATGYFGAQLGEIAEGDTVVVLGAGPVGLVAAQSAWLMGAGRVIVIDHLQERLEKARTMAQDRPGQDPGLDARRGRRPAHRRRRDRLLRRAAGGDRRGRHGRRPRGRAGGPRRGAVRVADGRRPGDRHRPPAGTAGEGPHHGPRSARSRSRTGCTTRTPSCSPTPPRPATSARSWGRSPRATRSSSSGPGRWASSRRSPRG